MGRGDVATPITETINRIEGEAHEQIRESLRSALRTSLAIGDEKLPASAAGIAEKHHLAFDALLYFDVVLTKREAAEFLCELGYAQSPALIEKQLLKEGRYRQRFGRNLTTFKGKRIYTYAELIAMIDRPLLQEKFEELCAEAGLKS